MNLINIEQTTIGGNLIETVNARELHEFLEVGRDFTNWIKGRIEQYGFSEGQDFTPILAESEIGRPRTEYYISLDMAKELSMVERNDKGKQARQYFIECERRVKEVQKTPTLPVEKAASHFLSFKTIATAFGLKDNAQLISANVATRKLTGFDFQQLLEIELATPDQIQYLTPTELGKTLTPTLSAQRVNKLLATHGLQTAVGRAWVITDEGLKYARVLDTGKARSDGTMVQQVKWAANTLEGLYLNG